MTVLSRLRLYPANRNIRYNMHNGGKSLLIRKHKFFWGGIYKIYPITGYPSWRGTSVSFSATRRQRRPLCAPPCVRVTSLTSASGLHSKLLPPPSSRLIPPPRVYYLV